MNTHSSDYIDYIRHGGTVVYTILIVCTNTCNLSTLLLPTMTVSFSLISLKVEKPTYCMQWIPVIELIKCQAVFFWEGVGMGTVHLHPNSVRTLGWLCFHGGILTYAFVIRYMMCYPKVLKFLC
jgi:hypothetical protein